MKESDLLLRLRSLCVREGDLVSLQNLHVDWGEFAMVTKVKIMGSGTGQIYLLTKRGSISTIPYITRSEWIKEIVNGRGNSR